jgi:hypothetical protein
MINDKFRSKDETKAAVFTGTATAALPTGGVTAVTQGIIQGIGNGQRTGNDITLARIRCKINTTAVGASGITRYIIFQDHEALGALPSVTDVLDSTSVVAGYNTINTVSRKRFKILADFSHAVPIGGEAVKVFDRYFSKELSKVVTFLGTTSTASANGKNAVFLLYIGTSTNVFDSSFTVQYYDS